MTTETAGDFRLQTPEEIEAVVAVLRDDGMLGENARIAYLGLLDPPRGAERAEASRDRRFRVFVLDVAGGRPVEAVVSATRRELLSLRELDSAVDGEFPVMEEEFAVVEAVLAQDPRWQEAMRTRGIPVEEVRVAPLSAGVFEYEEEKGHRILRGLAFHQKHEADSPWAHPIDGIVGYVDVTAKEVTQVIDLGAMPVPQEHGNYTDPELTGDLRTTQKPIEITQPEGPSFTVDGGNHVEWERWSLDIGFDMREGLVLQNIAFDDPHCDGRSGRDRRR